MSRRTRAAAIVLGITAVAAVVAFLLGIWTGDVRWHQTGAVLVGVVITMPFVGAALAIMEVDR